MQKRAQDGEIKRKIAQETAHERQVGGSMPCSGFFIITSFFSKMKVCFPPVIKE